MLSLSHGYDDHRGHAEENRSCQWLAYNAYGLAKGNIFVLASILMCITVFVSAFLDNVTTMPLMIPGTIEIALSPK